MWGRVVEMCIAVWLLLSPFIFRASDNVTAVWTDTLLALVIATLASLSYWRPTRHAHLVTLLVAIGMILWGRLSSSSPPPAIEQNHIFVGFFLLIIAIIPNEASRPPAEWRLRTKRPAA